MRGPLLLTIIFPATCARPSDPEASSSTAPRCVDPLTNATHPCAEIEAADGPLSTPRGSDDSNTDIDEADSNAIREAIQAQSSGVKRCYDRALPRAPDLQGRLVAEITLEDGRIMALELTVEEGRLDEGMRSCVRDEIRTWAFPANASGDLYVPFRLSAG